MSLPKYLKYKDSGERWLGAVPAHWQVHRLKNLFEIRKRIVGEVGHQVLSVTQRGIKVKDIESNDGQLSMDYSKYQIVLPGDFAMNHMDLLTGFVDISSFTGVTSPDYRVFAVRDGVGCEPRYFLHLLQNGYRQKIFYAFGQGASEFGRWRFPTDQFNDFRFPCPPRAEQTAIAGFLDRETAKIDALIVEQEKLIALLAEKRQATISHAVTRGLNPNAPMKDSGVAWLGEVPAHWVRTPIKHTLFTIIDTEHKTVPFYEDGKFLVARTSNIKNGQLLIEDAKYTDEEGFEEWTKRGFPEPGDILFTREAPAGEACIVPSGIPLCVGQRTVLMKVDRSKLNPRYGLWSIYGGLASEFVDVVSQGSTVPHFNMSDIGNIPLLLPSLNEQSAIVAFIDTEIEKLDALNTESEHAISLFKERRSALIAAAVTGQIDVRGLATL